MDLRYVHNDQAIAEGERAVLYQNGVLYVRTSFLNASVADPDMKTVTYRLREVYDKPVVAPPVNHPPVAADSNSSTVDQGVTP